LNDDVDGREYALLMKEMMIQIVSDSIPMGIKVLLNFM
jgi:hypothetical protein